MTGRDVRQRRERSYLFVPGDRPDRLARAHERGADALIADLEDAVAPGRRAEARAAVARWLAQRVEDPAAVYVRVNADDLEADLAAVVAPGLDGVCVPKVGSADDLVEVDRILGSLESRAGLAPRSVGVLALVESAAAVLSAAAIARAPRVVALAMGEADLSADLGLDRSSDEEALRTARSLVVLASTAAELGPPVAGVSTDFRDLAALRESTRSLRRLGFGARLVIHPAQVEIVNEVFTPTPDEVERARQLVERYDASLAAGDGVVVDAAGRMVDEAVVRRARLTLRRAPRS